MLEKGGEGEGRCRKKIDNKNFIWKIWIGYKDFWDLNKMANSPKGELENCVARQKFLLIKGFVICFKLNYRKLRYKIEIIILIFFISTF